MLLFIYGRGAETLARDLMQSGAAGFERLRVYTTDKNDLERTYLERHQYDARQKQGCFFWTRECEDIKQGVSYIQLGKAFATEGSVYLMTLREDDVTNTHRFYKARGKLHDTQWIFVGHHDEMNECRTTLTLSPETPRLNLGRVIGLLKIRYEAHYEAQAAGAPA